MSGFSSGVAPGRATLSAALLEFLRKHAHPLPELLDACGWPVGTPVDATLLQRYGPSAAIERSNTSGQLTPTPRNRVADAAAQHSAEAFLNDFGFFAMSSMLDEDEVLQHCVI